MFAFRSDGCPESLQIIGAYVVSVHKLKKIARNYPEPLDAIHTTNRLAGRRISTLAFLDKNYGYAISERNASFCPVCFPAKTRSVENALSASESERVPTAESFVPVKGNESGPRWH